MKKLLPIFICALFASCFNEGDCLVSATNYMHIQFKKKSNHKLDTSVGFNYIYFVGTDSAIDSFRVSEIILPIDIAVDSPSTEYVFQTWFTNKVIVNDTLKTDTLTRNDTLRVGYARQSKVVSKDCGAYTFYQNLNIIKSTFGPNIKAFSTSLVKDPTATGISSYAINYQIYF